MRKRVAGVLRGAEFPLHKMGSRPSTQAVCLQFHSYYVSCVSACLSLTFLNSWLFDRWVVEIRCGCFCFRCAAFVFLLLPRLATYDTDSQTHTPSAAIFSCCCGFPIKLIVICFFLFFRGFRMSVDISTAILLQILFPLNVSFMFFYLNYSKYTLFIIPKLKKMYKFEIFLHTLHRILFNAIKYTNFHSCVTCLS